MQYYDPNYYLQTAVPYDTSKPQTNAYEAVVGKTKSDVFQSPDWYQNLVQKRFGEGDYGIINSNVDQKGILSDLGFEGRTVRNQALQDYNLINEKSDGATPWIYGEGGKNWDTFDIVDYLKGGQDTFGVYRYKFNPTQASGQQLSQDYLTGGNIDAFDIWLQNQGKGSAAKYGWGANQIGRGGIGFYDNKSQAQQAQQNAYAQQNAFLSGAGQNTQAQDLYRNFLQQQYGSGRNIYSGAWV